MARSLSDPALHAQIPVLGLVPQEPKEEVLMVRGPVAVGFAVARLAISGQAALVGWGLAGQARVQREPE